MKATCPACGFAAGLEAYIADADWRDAVMAAAELPSDCGALAIRYVGLFRPEKRALSPDRAARLIREVCDMIIKGLDFDRRRIEAPSHVWRQALIEILERPDLRRPLRNHNYLLRIVQSKLAERSDALQDDRYQQHRGTPRINSGPKHMSEVISSLPELPKDTREERLARAREILLAEGFHERFLSAPLVEQKAREIYAEEVADGSNQS